MANEFDAIFGGVATAKRDPNAVDAFDPEGSGFDLKTFKESGGVPDETGHMGSLDPRTGMLLKGINHPTINLTLAEEKRLGNKIVKKDDRFFSVPITEQDNAFGDIFAPGQSKQNANEFDAVFADPTRKPSAPDAKSPSTTDTDALFSQLGGRLPASAQILASQTTGEIAQDIDIPIPKLAVMGEKRKQEEIGRRTAFTGLIREGFTVPQLELSLRTEKVLKAKEGIRVGKFIGGTAAGLVAGQLVPGPADELLLLKAAMAALGAGAGGAAGEAVQTALEEKRLINRKEALRAFTEEALFEAGGRAVALGGKAILSPFIKRTVPEAAALVDDFAKVGGTFSPTELDERFTLRTGEAFARGSFGTEKIFQDFEEKQGKAVVSFARNIIDSIGDGVARQTPEEIGETFARGITRPDGRIFNIFDELIDPLYKQVDELAKVGGLSAFRQVRTGGKVATRAIPTPVNRKTLTTLGNTIKTKLGIKENIIWDFQKSEIRTRGNTTSNIISVFAKDDATLPEIKKVILHELGHKALPLPPGTPLSGTAANEKLVRQWVEDNLSKIQNIGEVARVRGASGKFIPAKQLQRISLSPKVSTKSLKSFAEKQLATDKRLNGQFLSPIGRSKLQKIIGLKDHLSFSDMRTLRSSFLRDARKLARDVDQSQSIIKQLSGITDKAIFDPAAAKGLNPDALTLLRNTNALYKTGQEGIKTTFSETLAKRLLKNPSTIAKEAFPNDNPKAIRLLRESLIEPISGRKSAEGTRLWNQLRTTWLTDAVEKSTKEGVANPKVFDNIIRKMGEDAFSEIFPEKQIAKRVKSIQQLFSTAGKTPPRGVSLFARGAQLGGLKLMYDGGKEGNVVGFTVGAALAFGPMAFARLATTPGGVKFLTSGLKLKPGSSGLIPFAARAVSILIDLDRKENKQRLRELKLEEAKAREASRKAKSKTAPAGQLRGLGGRPLKSAITGRPLTRRI